MTNSYAKQLREKRESLLIVDTRWTQEFTAAHLEVSHRAYVGWEHGESEPTGAYRRIVQDFLSTSNRRLRKDAGPSKKEKGEKA